MTFYHGSDNEFLKELTTEHYGGKVYITDSYPLAVMYGGCPIRSWGYDKEKDLLLIYENNKDALIKMYKGVTCYIYSCEVDDAIKDESNRSNHTYIVNHNVKLKENKEIISDAYEKILELEKLGKIKIFRWEDLTKEEQIAKKEKHIKFWKPVMEENKLHYPKAYDVLINIYPIIIVYHFSLNFSSKITFFFTF